MGIRHAGWVCIAIACLLAVPGAGYADVAERGPAPQAEHLMATALRAAATAVLGPQADVRLGAVSISTYPLTDVTLYHAKATDRRTGRVVALAVDAQGRLVDGEAAFQAEKRAARERYGKLEPALYAALQDAPAEAEFTVCVWLAAGELPRPEGPWFRLGVGLNAAPLAGDPVALRARSREAEVASYGHLLSGSGVTLADVEASLRRDGARTQQLAASAQAPLLAALAEGGRSPTLVSQYLPMLWVTLSRAEIEALQQRPDVRSIGLRARAQNTMDNAKLTTFADYNWDEGYNGSGVKVAVIEVNGRAATDNPYLWGILQDAENACEEPCSHATAVAGMVRSRHVRYRGLAYGATLRVGGACGGWIDQLQSATERALAWGATVFNHSWGHNRDPGVSDASDRYFDELVWYYPSTQCIAAGNSGRDYDTAQVNHPALGYNVITVGANDDRDTITWSDDIMAPFSSFRDPASANGDRNKPELCAPGVSINATINSSPWIDDCGQGTSYASPLVASTAAMILQMRPELAAWPEAVKAILMASAINNIEYDWKMEGRDGAGGIDAQEAVTKLTRRGTWGAFWVSPDGFDQNNNMHVAVTLPEADLARAVIVWGADPNDADYPDRPHADLDLYWLDASAQVITESETGDNNYEVVGVYDVAPAGRRILRIHAYRKPETAMRLGWAVHYWDE